MKNQRRTAGQESEKSAAVHSSNWREEVMLRRTLEEIHRIKASISNDIWMEQRVFYKRFQEKITRSQIAYARAIGNKELERQLREKHHANSHGFNTACGMNEEDSKLLQKLIQQRHEGYKSVPQTAQTLSSTTPTITSTRLNYRRSMDYHVMNPERHAMNHVIDDDRPRRSSLRRPRTVGFVRRSSSNDSLNSVAQSESGEELVQKLRLAYSESKLNRANNNSYDDDKPRTALPRLQSNALSERRPTRVNIVEDPDEIHRSTLKTINHKRLMSARYEARVKNFCNSVDAMKTPANFAGDYYAVSLGSLDHLQHQQRAPPLRRGLAERMSDSEYLRYTGDVNVRNITFRSVEELGSTDEIYLMRRPSMGTILKRIPEQDMTAS